MLLLQGVRDDANASDFWSKTLTRHALIYWKHLRVLRKRSRLIFFENLVTVKTIILKWHRLIGQQRMQRMCIEVYQEWKRYARLFFPVWKFAWKERLGTKGSSTKEGAYTFKASFRLWLHKVHFQREKIGKHWLGLIRAILEHQAKKERKKLKRAVHKIFRERKLELKAKTVEPEKRPVSFGLYCWGPLPQ